MPRDFPGTASTMMATLLACSIAAPTACRTLNPASETSPGASPHSAEPSVKTTNPYTYSSFRPHISAKRPTAVTVATSTSR